MSARDRILARLREARGPAREAGAPQRDARPHPRAPASGSEPDPNGRFLRNARRLGSEVLEVDADSAVPAAVVGYLDAKRLGRRAVVWPRAADLPWQAAGLEVEARAASGGDRVGITGTFAAIAETGTLMLLSGPDTPASASLLPETHIAIVRAREVLATMEEAWARMRAGRAAAPRAVNFVSGPSRTADVEQTITVGAHGPRRVLIILVRG